MQTPSTTLGAATCPFRLQTSLLDPVARSAACPETLDAVVAITHWSSSRHADEFPYDAVVGEYLRVGKHFVAQPLLEALASVRAALSQARGSATSVQLLDRFLDTALDKWDGRYANPTYLGLSLLPLTTIDDRSHDIAASQRQYDRLFVQLIADASHFEIATADGATPLLPRLRPDARTTAKRCRLGLQAAEHAARRLGWGKDVATVDPIAGARQLWANVAAELPLAERRMLQLTMLPVSVIHDEYQFVRVLQSFEATFALVAVQLHAAVQALTNGESDLALQCVLTAETALREAAPLWSLVATMRVEAFQTFRTFTEGASAIQSRNYKLVESMCRQPESSRLDSAAYLSVPEVRQRVLAGQATLDGAFSAARAAGSLSARDCDEMEQAMRHFAATLRRWRRTHHRLAVRMLGERTGTGYTEGASYLEASQAIPVFASVALEDAAEARDHGEANEVVPAQPSVGVIGAQRRCPFAMTAARA